MSDAAAINRSGFIDRSRFRSSFNDSNNQNQAKKVEAKIALRTQSYQDDRPVQSVQKDKNIETDSKNKDFYLDQLYNQHFVKAPASGFISESLDVKTKSSRFFRLSSFLSSLKRVNKFQLVCISAAILVVIFGVYLSYLSLENNKAVHSQAVKLTAEANKSASDPSNSTNASSVISTVKPTPKTIAAYSVAPNYPKYLKIPSIGVDAIVGQTGILANGALGTPSNVYYTDWYTGSAEPGQPGATLIDGHVSSWTSKGVFYNLHDLKAGDLIQIIKGDNSVVNYKVVKTVVFSSNNVDMQSAITPVTPGVSGLNLITCTGQVIKGTSTFNQRVIVYSEEV